jgi:hypothetical protein
VEIKMKMPKYFILFIICALAFPLMTRAPMYAKQNERVLVLGFESKQLNDVQERLLRETLMRRFLAKGHRIVQVMEVESLFHDGRKRQIRKLKDDEVRALCNDLRAGLACTGSIVPEDGTEDNKIEAEMNYICTIRIYRKERDAFDEFVLKIAGEKDLYRFFNAMAEGIVSKIDSLP